jgi:hypothetical protein
MRWLVQIDVYIPANACGRCGVVTVIPAAGMVVVVVIIAAFVAARQ